MTSPRWRVARSAALTSRPGSRGGDNGCGGYGPTEFTATDSGWIGRLILRKSTIVILMQPTSS